MSDRSPAAPPDTSGRPRVGPAALLFGVLGPPAAWFLHLILSFSTVGWVCRSGMSWIHHGITLATAALAIAGGSVAWRSAQRMGGGGGADGGRTGAARFLAWSGMAFAFFFGLAVLIEGIPPFLLPACPP